MPTRSRANCHSPPFPEMNFNKPILVATILSSLTVAGCGGAEGAEDPSNARGAESAAPPTAMESIEAMVADCEACAEERAARHADSPLYGRLGGHEGISAFVTTLIEQHLQNDVVRPFFDGVDQGVLAANLVDFIGAGTGGTETYSGRSILESHANMGVTPEVFLAAGGDIQAAMNEVGWGADEQQEFMCVILSMKDQVIEMPGD